MSSSFARLDYSEQENREMLDVVHVYEEKGPRDELKNGTIRDGRGPADFLFRQADCMQTPAQPVSLLQSSCIILFRITSANVRPRPPRGEPGAVLPGHH
jgi:hypothetical protein